MKYEHGMNIPETPEEEFGVMARMTDKYLDEHGLTLGKKSEGLGKLEGDLTRAFEQMPKKSREEHQKAYDSLMEEISNAQDISIGIVL